MRLEARRVRYLRQQVHLRELESDRLVSRPCVLFLDSLRYQKDPMQALFPAVGLLRAAWPQCYLQHFVEMDARVVQQSSR